MNVLKREKKGLIKLPLLLGKTIEKSSLLDREA